MCESGPPLWYTSSSGVTSRTKAWRSGDALFVVLRMFPWRLLSWWGDAFEIFEIFEISSEEEEAKEVGGGEGRERKKFSMR